MDDQQQAKTESGHVRTDCFLWKNNNYFQSILWVWMMLLSNIALRLDMMTMNIIYHKCHFKMRNILCVKHLLNDYCTKLLIHSFITAHFHFCNSLLNDLQNQLKGYKNYRKKAFKVTSKISNRSHYHPLFFFFFKSSIGC